MSDIRGVLRGAALAGGQRTHSRCHKGPHRFTGCLAISSLQSVVPIQHRVRKLAIEYPLNPLSRQEESSGDFRVIPTAKLWHRQRSHRGRECLDISSLRFG
jgi:hypothetical protein